MLLSPSSNHRPVAETPFVNPTCTSAGNFLDLVWNNLGKGFYVTFLDQSSTKVIALKEDS